MNINCTRCRSCERCRSCSDCQDCKDCYGLHGARNQANLHMPCRIIMGTYRVQHRGMIKVYKGKFLQHSQTTVTIDTDQPWITVGDPL